MVLREDQEDLKFVFLLGLLKKVRLGKLEPLANFQFRRRPKQQLREALLGLKTEMTR